MAKLYFYYSAMNAGKSTVLLQSAYNYNERGMDTLLFTSAHDVRYGKGKIASRLGLNQAAIPYDANFDLYEHAKIAKENNPKLSCVLLDEAQFLTKQQVYQLTDIVDKLNLPVLAYGLRSDYRGEPFEGSLYLLIWADNLVEIKTICHCGKKAIMNVRVDDNGKFINQGEQLFIGGNDHYISVCRKHYKELTSSR